MMANKARYKRFLNAKNSRKNKKRVCELDTSILIDLPLLLARRKSGLTGPTAVEFSPLSFGTAASRILLIYKRAAGTFSISFCNTRG